MIPTPLNLGAAPNDGKGDPVRTIFQAINANFAQAFAAAPKCSFDAISPPRVTDDFVAGYELGSLWLVPARGMLWRCSDPTPGAARWVPFGTMDHPGYRPDTVYGAPVSASASGAIAANTLYAMPVAILTRTRIKQLFIGTAASVAGSAKLGIYAHDYDNKVPASLIAECNADIATDGTAGPYGAAFTSNPDLPPGIYWLAACASAAANLFQVTTSFAAGGLMWMWGGSDPYGFLGGGASTVTARFTRDAALTYLAATQFFPSDFGPGTFGTGTPGSPLIVWRAE